MPHCNWCNVYLNSDEINTTSNQEVICNECDEYKCVQCEKQEGDTHAADTGEYICYECERKLI